MALDLTEIFIFILSTVISIIGFYLRRIYEKMDFLEGEVNSHRLHDASYLATKDELKELKHDIKDFLSSVKEQLNNIENYLRQAQK